MPPGDVGDDPSPHAENRVVSVAPEAIWHAPAQNWRRESGAFVSDIVMYERGVAVASGQFQGHAQTAQIFLNQQC
jgi:hypothetical protein